MRNKEFLERVISTDRANLKHFLKIYFCKEAQIYVGKGENVEIDGKRRKAFYTQVIIAGHEEEGYAILERKVNGFVLFVPKEGRAVRFTVRDSINTQKKGCPMEKKVKIENFQRNDKEGTYFMGDLGRYLKGKTKSVYC